MNSPHPAATRDGGRAYRRVAATGHRGPVGARGQKQGGETAIRQLHGRRRRAARRTPPARHTGAGTAPARRTAAGMLPAWRTAAPTGWARNVPGLGGRSVPRVSAAAPPEGTVRLGAPRVRTRRPGRVHDGRYGTVGASACRRPAPGSRHDCRPARTRPPTARSPRTTTSPRAALLGSPSGRSAPARRAPGIRALGRVRRPGRAPKQPLDGGASPAAARSPGVALRRTRAPPGRWRAPHGAGCRCGTRSPPAAPGPWCGPSPRSAGARW